MHESCIHEGQKSCTCFTHQHEFLQSKTSCQCKCHSKSMWTWWCHVWNPCMLMFDLSIMHAWRNKIMQLLHSWAWAITIRDKFVNAMTISETCKLGDAMAIHQAHLDLNVWYECHIPMFHEKCNKFEILWRITVHSLTWKSAFSPFFHCTLLSVQSLDLGGNTILYGSVTGLCCIAANIAKASIAKKHLNLKRNSGFNESLRVIHEPSSCMTCMSSWYMVWWEWVQQGQCNWWQQKVSKFFFVGSSGCQNSCATTLKWCKHVPGCISESYTRSSLPLRSLMKKTFSLSGPPLPCRPWHCSQQTTVSALGSKVRCLPTVQATTGNGLLKDAHAEANKEKNRFRLWSESFWRKDFVPRDTK